MFQYCLCTVSIVETVPSESTVVSVRFPHLPTSVVLRDDRQKQLRLFALKTEFTCHKKILHIFRLHFFFLSVPALPSCFRCSLHVASVAPGSTVIPACVQESGGALVARPSSYSLRALVPS